VSAGCLKCGAVALWHEPWCDEVLPPPTAYTPNPDHDSLFTRFEQLEKLLNQINAPGSGLLRRNDVLDAIELVKLLRAQVLK